MPTGDSPATYRNIFHDRLPESLTFLSGFRLTATFENVGQNKSLRLNKLRQFSFVWIALEMTRRSVLLCLRVSHNVVFSSFFSTSLPFLRLGQGSLQFFYDPTRSLIRISAEKGNILPSDSQTLHSNHSSCFFLLLPSAVYQGIRIMVELVNNCWTCSYFSVFFFFSLLLLTDITRIVFQGIKFIVGDFAEHSHPMCSIQCQCRQQWPLGNLA